MKRHAGKREREARKAPTKRRNTITIWSGDSGWQTLKLGSKKYREHIRKGKIPF